MEGNSDYTRNTFTVIDVMQLTAQKSNNSESNINTYVDTKPIIHKLILV